MNYRKLDILVVILLGVTERLSPKLIEFWLTVIAFQDILNYVTPPCLRAYLTIVLSFIFQKLNEVGDKVLIENVQILLHVDKRREFEENCISILVSYYSNRFP